MRYLGGKAKIANDLLRIMLKHRRQAQCFADLFCGGCNVIDKVTGVRIANDANPYLIALWQGIQSGFDRPVSISQQDHKDCLYLYRHENIENLDPETAFVVAWVGHMASFNSMFFAGYSGNYKNRDFISESIANIEKQIPQLIGVPFFCGSYDEVFLPDESIIYCDIPYQGTTGYAVGKDFDYDKFFLTGLGCKLLYTGTPCLCLSTPHQKILYACGLKM